MADYEINGYHATSEDASQSILNYGFKPMPGGANVWGRGNYFWLDPQDADACMHEWFPNDGVVLRSTMEFDEDEFITFDDDALNLLQDSSKNQFSQLLIDAGINYVHLPNAYMRHSTPLHSTGGPHGDAIIQLTDTRHTDFDPIDDYANELSQLECEYVDRHLVNLRQFRTLRQQGVV